MSLFLILLILATIAFLSTLVPPLKFMEGKMLLLSLMLVVFGILAYTFQL